MKKINLALLLGAAVGLALAACGDLGTGDGGTGGCTSDATCATGQGCHPLLKTCMDKCTTATDCSASQNTCDVINASASKFCQCGSDSACNTATAGNICMQTTKTCSKACTSTSGCSSGQTCDVVTGQCKAAAVVDAGSPADAGSVESCTYGSCSKDTEFCNVTTLKCEDRACNTAGQLQPDTCGYANVCDGANHCANNISFIGPSCANFTPPGGKTPVFNAATSTGPIIYAIGDMNPDSATWCGAGTNTFSVKVYAYRTDADWPAQLSAIPGFKYVKTDGTELSATTSMFPSGSGYKPTGKMATFEVHLCTATTITSNLSAGFYFSNGNEACGLAVTPNQ